MSLTATGLLIFFVMVCLVLIGIPIFLSMLISCFAGFCIVGGLPMAITQFTTAPLNVGASYTYAVLPLFMLIGTLAGETGIAEGAFDSLQKWLGRIRGGLLYTLVGANAIFGACSGISTAGNIVFSNLAMPELEKAGYDRRLSLGIITSSGCLSSLIPPSVPIILICMMIGNLSISKALTYGLSCGILMVVVLCVGIFVYIRLSPSKIPSTKNYPVVPFKEKLISLSKLLPIVLVFLLIVGGTMLGWFAATLAGAVASTALIIWALIKKVPPKRIANCIWDAVVVNASFFLIIIAGNMFSRFITTTQLVSSLANIIAGLSIPNYLVFLAVVLFYVFCGCVMDIVSTIIITVPIVLPLMQGLGYDPYVICVILVFMCEIAGLTPPIGMNVFAVSSALRIQPTEIFRGVIPFFVVELSAILLIGAFPQIINWLPMLTGIS